MYAIIEVSGLQYKVTKGQKLRVNKLDTEVGKKVDFKEVLLVVDNDKVTVGKPVVAKTVVKATVLSHGKDKKVLVFKKKRRKGYKVFRGHRQEYTEIMIDKIGAEAEPKTKPAAAQSKPKTTEVKPKQKPAAAKTKTSEKKNTTAAKKPVAKTTKKEEK
ncbi:50S ribosomal protein L21 [bacterium]|nr:50S ribosomal protein L21 [bacterium]